MIDLFFFAGIILRVLNHNLMFFIVSLFLPNFFQFRMLKPINVTLNEITLCD